MEQTIASPKAGIVNRATDNTASRPIFVTVLFFLAIVWQKIRTGYWHVRNRLSPDISAALDVERISTQLAVVKRAEEDASRNMPPSDEEGPGGTQREIIAYFTNLRLRAQKHAAEDAERLNRTLEQIHISDSLAQLRDIPAGCEHKILRHVADSESRLNNAFEREQNQKKHYDAFRKRNGLDRVAHYPGTGYYFYLAVPLLVITIIVALARMVGTFSGGDSSVSVAWIATVSAAAVIVPFILGDSLLRSINHVGKFRKFVGWIGAIAATAAICGMASYTDFHIATVLANPDASNRDVLDAMLAAPLDVISSVANWKAFGLIGLTGLLAMLLAYRSDDPYPGYGAAQRAYYRERNAREEASARLRKRINTLIDESGAEVSTISKDFRDKVRTCTSLVEKLEKKPSALSDYDVELENTCNVVLDRYRVANAAARRSESPLSFAEHICFNPDSDLGSPQQSSGRHHVAELQTAIADLEKDADLARQKLRTLNLQMISSIAERHSVAAD
jgi:hypothetical protein